MNQVWVPDWLSHRHMAVVTGWENLYVTFKGYNWRHIDLRHVDIETSDCAWNFLYVVLD